MADAPLVIVNPAAGGGRAGRAARWIHDRLRARPDAGLEVAGRRGDVERIAASAHQEGFGRVIAVGGDGTVQEVLNGIAAGGGPLELGIMPMGSGNDLARGLHLPTDLERAWRVAVGHATRPVDVASARNGDGAERWFASAGGIGFDARVAASMARRRWWQSGRAGYLAATLAELRRLRNDEVEVTIDGQRRAQRVLFVAIANGPFYGAGMRIAPSARVDDGLLDVCVVGDVSRFTAIRELPNLYRGTHVRHPMVSMGRGRRVVVDGESATLAHLDGEPFGALPLTVTIGAWQLDVAGLTPMARRTDPTGHRGGGGAS
ncbi:MAG: diacylglycerol kinase family lipid kinase [Chloroflexi bacterium]|nr:diacylglycerol kinase family lipid kinase [Chloroflexota bacterium]